MYEKYESSPVPQSIFVLMKNMEFDRDKSIPDLDSMFLDDPNGDLRELSRLLEKQVLAEKEENTSSHLMDPEMECTPPPPCHEFQTARLFLSHFGLLSRLDSNKVPPFSLCIPLEKCAASPPPPLIRI